MARTLTYCLKRADLIDEEKAAIRDLTTQYRSDGLRANEAAQAAVRDMFEETQGEREVLAQQIQEKGGTVPPRAPSPVLAEKPPSEPPSGLPSGGKVEARAPSQPPGAQYTGYIEQEAPRPAQPRREEPIRRDKILVDFLRGLGLSVYEEYLS